MRYKWKKIGKIPEKRVANLKKWDVVERRYVEAAVERYVEATVKRRYVEVAV